MSILRVMAMGCLIAFAASQVSWSQAQVSASTNIIVLTNAHRAEERVTIGLAAEQPRTNVLRLNISFKASPEGGVYYNFRLPARKYSPGALRLFDTNGVFLAHLPQTIAGSAWPVSPTDWTNLEPNEEVSWDKDVGLGNLQKAQVTLPKGTYLLQLVYSARLFLPRDSPDVRSDGKSARTAPPVLWSNVLKFEVE